MPRTLDTLALTGISGVLLVAFYYQLALGELPCPLCALQRVGFIVAGVGLVIAGLSFFFLGGLDVLTKGPDAYGENLPFHLGLWIGGVPGFVLLPIWGILCGRTLMQE